MSTALLGTHFDLHGGGMDLKFPHHENEIAQSCAATGDRFVNLWMHNGFVNVDQEKMSKSLGNFFTVREVLPGLRHPEVLRYFVLSSHYRGPINYSLDQLEQADAALSRIYTALRDLPEVTAEPGEYSARFQESMDDDFNTAEALAVLQTLTRELNTAKDAGKAQRAAPLGAELRSLGAVSGAAGSRAGAVGPPGASAPAAAADGDGRQPSWPMPRSKRASPHASPRGRPRTGRSRTGSAMSWWRWG